MSNITVGLKEWEDLMKEAEQRIKELDADYRRVIREVLACDPRPAKDRADDQLEPPWEVVARVRRERDEARDLLRRAYNEAMDHDIDSRELDEKIKLILRERVLRGEDRPLDVPGPSGEENPPLADKEE